MTDSFGSYEIVRPLGRGGMGEVFLATDKRLGRQVAVKRLFQPGPAALEEARAAASLVHPNVVTLFGIEEMGNEETLLVMEFVEGQPLRALMSVGSLSDRLHLFSQVLDGVSAAHDRHLVHCDLKPSNVMVTRDGRAKILDFGIARLSQAATEARAPSRGTAGYMAPEQYRGQRIGCPADVFALGAILYELITGEMAFQGDTSTEISMRVVSEAPPRLAQLRGDPATKALAGVLEVALNKDPARRFESAIAMRDSFHKATGRGVPRAAAKPKSQPKPAVGLADVASSAPGSRLTLLRRRLRAWWRRAPRRRRLAALMLLLLAGLLVLGAAALLALEASGSARNMGGGGGGATGGMVSGVGAAPAVMSGGRWDASAYASSPYINLERAYVASMKSDLRNLVTAQEAYFSDNNSAYASSLAAMGTNYRASSGVEVRIVESTATGWTAAAAHALLPSVMCRISVGGTATNEGEPVCERVP